MRGRLVRLWEDRWVRVVDRGVVHCECKAQPGNVHVSPRLLCMRRWGQRHIVRIDGATGDAETWVE